MNPPNRRISLFLGSGGARGLAHIGVIEWLRSKGYAIESIAGSSMGALIGGIYAAGKLDVYADWVRALERRDVVKLLDFSWRQAGLFKGERIISALMVLLSLMTGVLLLIGGYLRLGFVAIFLSQPILNGFLGGTALVLILGQMKPLLGYSGTAIGLQREADAGGENRAGIESDPSGTATRWAAPRCRISFQD